VFRGIGVAWFYFGINASNSFRSYHIDTFIKSIAFSLGWRHFFSAGSGWTPPTCDVKTGQIVTRFEGHVTEVAAVAFTLTGLRIVS